MTLIAVIADIHGNADALKAVLADIDRQGIGTILNLGDHFSGPLAAHETADILMAREMVCIRGNHDRYLIEQAAADMGPSDRVALGELAPEHLDWLRALPVATSHEDIFLCHATPHNDETYLLETVTPAGDVIQRSAPEVMQLIGGIGAPLILCGHTHLQRSVRLPNGQRIVNPGSVGCPGYTDDAPVPHVVQAGSPDARYAVLEKVTGDWRVDLRQVPCETARMVRMAQSRGRPEWARGVGTGWIETGQI